MPTLINICGAGRSGTTMLDLMLGNAPDAFSCGEVSAWFRPWRTHHFRIDCSCHQDPCPYWSKIKDYPERNFHRQVFEQLNVNYVIDSSKEIRWIVDNNNWAARHQIRVINLLIWKDPMDLAYSYWKRDYGPFFWRRVFVDYYTKFLQVELPFVSVSHKELVQHPGEKLAHICQVVGMPYFQGKERFWEKEHHFVFGSGGVQKQTAYGTSEIRSDDPFTPQFRQEMENLSEKIDQDAQVQKILGALKKAEVSHYDRNMTLLYQQSALPVAKRPFWYYKDWLKRKIRGYFPSNIQNQYPPLQGHGSD